MYSKFTRRNYFENCILKNAVFNLLYFAIFANLLIYIYYTH